MDRTFCFALEEKEYIDYLCSQISHSKLMRGYRWFIMTSVPALLLTGTLLLKIRQWLFVSSIIALAVIWVLYGASAVWKRFIRRKIKAQFLPKMNIKEFQEIKYHFGEQGIEYKDKKKKVNIAYGDIAVMLPLESEFAFCYRGGAVLLPYRVFSDEEDLKQFVMEYERKKSGK